MILYVNGDSNSTTINHGRDWPTILQNHFNCELINQALGGGSNPRILRTTVDFLDQIENTASDHFVVIGWTSWEREEWVHNGSYYQVNASGMNKVPDELKEKYINWIADKDSISQINKSRTLHKEIIDLHYKLEKLQVKHLFFNALMPFQHEALVADELRFNWGNNFIGPYENDLSYYWYLKKRNFVADNLYHYGKDGHQAWAEFLIDYIEGNKLL